MFIVLGVILTALCAWVPIIFGVDSFAIAFIGGLCGLIVALGIYIAVKISEIKKDQAEILRRLENQEKDKNENGQNS